uniref:TF-B3 domain-containing protein n=1 Tax=Arundo donax TaxID=35708 RepID=A0A0A9FBV2_ARUDO
MTDLATLQRIPEDLAEEIGAGEALVVVPFGKGKVRRVEVRWDGDGAFLSSGWPEFADACGVGAGWLLVLRHHGGGVLTIKVFDSSCCLRKPAMQPPAAMSRKDASCRPQFINVLPPDSMQKMAATLHPQKALEQSDGHTFQPPWQKVSN